MTEQCKTCGGTGKAMFAPSTTQAGGMGNCPGCNGPVVYRGVLTGPTNEAPSSAMTDEVQVEQRLSELAAGLTEPYYFHPDPVPGVDFNRDMFPPGADEKWPDGLVGIRVDDDFWVVAALPWSYRDVPLQKICEVLWPESAAHPLFEVKPDSAHGPLAATKGQHA